MRFNSYEDMLKAVENRRMIADEMTQRDIEAEDFIDAMLEAFEIELESRCEAADNNGYDLGYDDGYNNGYDAAVENLM